MSSLSWLNRRHDAPASCFDRAQRPMVHLVAREASILPHVCAIAVTRAGGSDGGGGGRRYRGPLRDPRAPPRGPLAGASPRGLSPPNPSPWRSPTCLPSSETSRRCSRCWAGPPRCWRCPSRLGRITIAGLATVGSRRPILVAVPTTAEAERLVNDLTTFLGPDAVELFPAWETLPFERVSPGVETMGRRLRTIWRLRAGADDAAGGRGRARCGRWSSGSAPTSTRSSRSWCAPGEQRDQADARGVAGRQRLPARGPGRAPGRVRGARLDRRRVRVHRRRPGAHRPVGRRGRPAHRVLGERPALHRRPRRGRGLPVPGAAAHRRRAGAGRRADRHASRGVASSGSAWPRASCSTAWRAGCRGSSTTTGPSSTCCPTAAQVLLVEPRRLRDRAADLLAEEADLASSLARTWEVGDDRTFPRLHAEFDELFAAALGAGVDHDRHPRRARRRHGGRHGLEPGGGRRRGPHRPAPPAARRRLPDRGGRRRRGLGPAPRRPAARPGPVARRRGRRARPGLHPHRRQAGDPGRGRRHRPTPGPPGAAAPQARHRRLLRRPQARRLRRAPPARRRPLRRHGQAGHRRRRARLPAARVPGRRQALRPVATRSTPSATTPAATARRCRSSAAATGPRPRPGSSSEVQAVAQELVVLYQKRLHAPGHAFPDDTPWQRELEDAFPYRETPDQQKAIDEVKADMEAETPMDRLVCGDVGFGKTEVAVRAAFKAVQDGKQVAVLGAHHAARHPALPDLQRPLRRLPGAGRGAVPLPHRRPGQGGGRGRALRRGRLRDRHPPPAVRGHRVQGPRPAGGGRGAALRRHPQGADQAVHHQRRRAHALGHADPADPGAEPHRHPRPHPAQHAAGRAPADPHLRRRVRRPGGGRGASAASCCARARCSSCTTGCETSRTAPATSASWCPRPGWRWPTGRWTRARSRRWCSTSGRASSTCSVCTTIIESGIDMPTVNTLVVDRADRLGLGPAPPAAGPGRPVRAAGLRLPVPPRRRVAQRGGLRAAQDHRRGHRARLGLPHRHARPRDPRRGHAARHRPERPHRRGGLRPLRLDGPRGRAGAEGRADPRAGRGQARPAPRRQPVARVRAQGGAAARGLPPPGRGHHRRRGRTTSAPSGRTASARCPRRPPACSTWPACGPRPTASASARSTSPRARRSAARRGRPGSRRWRSRPASRSAWPACSRARSTRSQCEQLMLPDPQDPRPRRHPRRPPAHAHPARRVSRRGSGATGGGQPKPAWSMSSRAGG